MPLQPIHEAAVTGNEAEVVRLVREDAGQLNARVQGVTKVTGWPVQGCTALVLAAWKGHDAVVARLLALGADVDVESLKTAAHWACYGKSAFSLSLLLDAGAPINSRSSVKAWTPLMNAAYWDAPDCVALLIARGGSALELDAQAADTRATALLRAASQNHPAIVSLLLHAGADPTIRNSNGHTPLDIARSEAHAQCTALLQAALAEPQRPRLLFKARALIEADRAVARAFDEASSNGLPRIALQKAVLAAAPAYLQGRVERAQEMPAVKFTTTTTTTTINDTELGACLRFVLGLQGHGGWAGAEDERATMRTEGLFPELFIELLELLVPRWDGARKGKPLGEGMDL